MKLLWIIWWELRHLPIRQRILHWLAIRVVERNPKLLCHGLDWWIVWWGIKPGLWRRFICRFILQTQRRHWPMRADEQ